MGIPAPPPMGGVVAPPPNPGLQRFLSYYDRGHRLANEGAAHAVPAATKQKFDRVVETWASNKPQEPTAWPVRARTLRVSDFIALTDPERLTLVDDIWAEMLILKQCLTPRNQMVDPAPRAFPGLTQSAAGFRNGGYCFRCDRRAPVDVLQHGFINFYTFNPPADIQGTLPHRAVNGVGMARHLGMWKANRDAVNEMTVCVSRNMKGSTKFPFPEYTGTAYIYAIKLPADKLGFDTENWQASEVGGLWLPGEKAFLDIAGNCIIASVEIVKEAAVNAGELHRFRFVAHQWTYAAGATYADRATIGPELTALYNGGATQAVLAANDFIPGE